MSQLSVISAGSPAQNIYLSQGNNVIVIDNITFLSDPFRFYSVFIHISYVVWAVMRKKGRLDQREERGAEEGRQRKEDTERERGNGQFA